MPEVPFAFCMRVRFVLPLPAVPSAYPLLLSSVLNLVPSSSMVHPWFAASSAASASSAAALARRSSAARFLRSALSFSTSSS
eukprot:CAMPEP_0182528428 /NCGR_PEP_ID=MMETSP1323-20130603/4502_1 /TAXON_ID=236787 /ORGANISM="Florenciella parvula, Strain RCC1693" /LENGTH=81 /DNA_ID=CAMNT_0024737547 /DNA_START=441 /DNA_END=683 /DNA_ORIENTATION=-